MINLLHHEPLGPKNGNGLATTVSVVIGADFDSMKGLLLSETGNVLIGAWGEMLILRNAKEYLEANPHIQSPVVSPVN